MKTNFVAVYLLFGGLFFGLNSFKTQPDFCKYEVVQELITIDGVYDGKEDYGYNFIVIDVEGKERTLTFQKAEKSVLDTFNLDIETLIKMKFKITYSISTIKVLDEDGYEDTEEINTIIKLEKL